MHLVHFADLKADTENQIRRIADFIGTPVDAAGMDRILSHCSFDYMKANAEHVAPLGGAFWEGGAKTFIFKGTNGRWEDELSQPLSDRYEQAAIAQLGEACANWLKHGAL